MKFVRIKRDAGVERAKAHAAPFSGKLNMVLIMAMSAASQLLLPAREPPPLPPLQAISLASRRQSEPLSWQRINAALRRQRVDTRDAASTLNAAAAAAAVAAAAGGSGAAL